MSTQHSGPLRRRPKDRSDKSDAVLAALRTSAPVTVSALATATGYSRPTVTEILSEFASAGVTTESEPEEQGVGRPASTWDLRQDAGTVVGLDLLPASALVAAADMRCHVLAARHIALPTASAEERLEAVTTTVRHLTAGLSGHGPLRAVAASATGRVSDDGTVLQADLAPAWTGFPLAQRLGEELGVPAVVDNDINAAALGEFHARRQEGRIRPNGDLLFVQLARGLHTGLVLGGAIHRGHEFNAGEIADFLDLRLDEQTLVTDTWITRVALTVASVGAVVDPDAIVLSSPSESSRATVTRVLQALSALRTPSSPSFAAEVSELGWAAGVVGALHRALATADRALTGAALPRPVALTGTSLIQSTLEKGRHSTMTTTHQTPTRTLHVGVVGVGARSTFTLAAELEQNNGRIVAVCDPHPLVAERVRARLRREPEDVVITSTVDELIATGIDVAFVTSPDDTHAAVTCALLEAGVPVYLEKPLATDLDDATRVLTTAHRTGTRLYVGHNMRHMNVVRTMRDIIRSGRIGEVKAIWCRHFVGHGGDFYFKDWHADRSRSNTLLLQKAAHDIDVMHWLADAHTTEVVAMGGLTVYDRVTDRADNSDRLMSDWFSEEHWPPLAQKELNPVIDVEDLSMVLMRMSSGVYASYEQCHYTPDYWRNYTVIGTEGRIENFGDGEGGVIRLWNRRSDYRAEGDETFPILGDAGGHGDADVLTITEFIRFVREGAATDTSPLGAWYAVAAGIQAAGSLRDGSTPRSVPELDPELVAYFTHNQNRV
ncbi:MULTISPECIES: ROK family protein [unclassified Actinomyces]|uniref:ROK family protein n=2 Tax=Actinomyces TaxID=1654 RepID=UPI002892A72E|nr:ROK family protein [Actinomyces sp. 187325]MCL3777977.1 ROK family protein [Actinomyces sp. AC-20-1]MCL3789636.1 ROK family protein [Actinomyces sp. 187325]MCL3794670.1 ROK family protein [Actinomyces sp. 217892]